MKTTSDTRVGVLIGRFQVPELTEGHKKIIDYVQEHHSQVVILLGRPDGVRSTKRNPFDHPTRRLGS
jgi:nicotinamide mononucleotide adenylyltransferase